MNSEERQMEQRVLEALAALNKPPGLPESAYWSDDLALWIYQIVKLAVKDGASETMIEFFGKDEIPDWEKEDEI
jgi:hypothetical protein